MIIYHVTLDLLPAPDMNPQLNQPATPAMDRIRQVWWFNRPELRINTV